MTNDEMDNEVTPVQEEVSEATQVAPEANESVESINFRKMREDRDKDREARIRAEYESEKMREYINNIEAQKQKQSEPEVLDDEYVEYKEFKNVKDNQRIHQEQSIRYEKMLSDQEKQLARMRLVSEFKDYDSVVTEKNLDVLERKHPELSPAILNAASEYDCGKAAYLFVKKFVGEEQARAYTNNAAQQNLTRPLPAVSAGAQESNSPLSKVNNYAKDYININFNDDYWENLRREKESAMRKRK